MLGTDDWEGRSIHPVYGMPNYRSGNLIVAATTNPFWAGFLDVIEEDAPEQAATVADAYGGPDGGVDLSPFFDLLAVHE